MVDFYDDDPELRVCASLSSFCGADVAQAGERNQSYDLEIKGHDFPGVPDPFLRNAGLASGRYEIKSLWQRPSGSFDPRFKLGQRGEKLYGRRDAEVKSFAQALELELDNIIEHSVTHHPKATPGTVLKCVDDIHDAVDKALSRKHSKSYMERLLSFARAAVNIPNLTRQAQILLKGGISQADILSSLDGLAGLFIVAGPIYTLVAKDEYSEFFAFDSASSEGPRLRYVGVIPSNKSVREK